MTQNMQHQSKRHTGILNVDFRFIVLGVLLSRLILLPLTQTVDADAVSRILDGLTWSKNPEWYLTAYWSPFLYYLQGTFFWLWPNTLWAPKVLSIILSVLTLIPFFYWVRREFDEEVAKIAILILGFSPMFMHNSFMGLSEPPYLFFTVLALNYVSKSKQENDWRLAALAGFFLTLAIGFRYEAALIAPAVLPFYWFGENRSFANILAFSAGVGIFPLIWAGQHIYLFGNPIIFLEHNYVWMASLYQVEPDFESYLRRLWFYPFTVWLCIGPIAVFLFFKRSKAFVHHLLLIVPFTLLMLIMEYNCFTGKLMTQNRLSLILSIFIIPVAALGFQSLKRKQLMLVISVLLTLGLTYVYNITEIQPVPRLRNQQAVQVSEELNAVISPQSALIIPNYNWQDPFYIVLRSHLHREQLTIYETGDESWKPTEELDNLLQNFDHGVFIAEEGTAFKDEILSTSNIQWKKGYQYDRFTFYEWNRVPSAD